MAWKIGLWIARIIATVLIACILSIWTTGYVVTSYVQSLVKQFELPLEVEPVAFADVWGMLWGKQRTVQDEVVEKEVADASAEAQGGKESEEEPLDSLDQEAGTQAGNDEDAAEPGSGEGVNEEVNEEGDTSSNAAEFDDSLEPAQEALAPIEGGSTPTITPEEIDASKESIAMEDKERMFELMMNKLPPESWQMFSTYLEDGLTEQELLDIQQMMAQHLSREEYDELMAILEKY